MKEIWKDIHGYELLYQISNLGNVKSLERITSHNHKKKERILVLNKNSSGYLLVSLYKNSLQKTFSVHQLVAISFLNHKPNGFTLVVNHKDFNKKNNNVDNLEVVTVRENVNQKHMLSSSIYTGVSWSKSNNKWHSQIHIEKKSKSLGFYKTEEEASIAYEIALNNLLNILK
tara:strand:+ start:120 stop:635 length:516 start_codon:yes stop_codon:yes gene_type:complete